MSYLSIAGLKKRYDGKQVLHGIDVEIAQGQFVVIVGPSGCGKSTLLRMVAGLENVTEGSISIDGSRVDDLDPADRGCAMVFQNYALYPHMSVRDNISYPLKIARLPRPERERRVAEAASMLDLEGLLDRRPAQLSGGQRQRVAMGRALVREPRIFLFDEPLSNLDAKLRVSMRIEIKRLHRRLKATSIFVTHDQVEAMTLADLLIVMNGGRIEQIGSPVSIYREPASMFVAGFLGAPAMNLLPARVTAGKIVLDGVEHYGFDASHLVTLGGKALTIGIRPEDIAVTRSGDTGLSAGIDLIEELGGSRVAYCSLGSEEVAIVMPQDSEYREGDKVGIELPLRHFHAFDNETGLRMASVPAVSRAA